MCFTIFYNERTTFSAIKKKVWGVVHGFGPKLVIFPNFFVGNIGHGNVSYDILEVNNNFPGYKSKNTKN